jgi:hypothetical protein
MLKFRVSLLTLQYDSEIWNFTTLIQLFIISFCFTVTPPTRDWPARLRILNVLPRSISAACDNVGGIISSSNSSSNSPFYRRRTRHIQSYRSGLLATSPQMRIPVTNINPKGGTSLANSVVSLSSGSSINPNGKNKFPVHTSGCTQQRIINKADTNRVVLTCSSKDYVLENGPRKQLSMKVVETIAGCKTPVVQGSSKSRDKPSKVSSRRVHRQLLLERQLAASLAADTDSMIHSTANFKGLLQTYLQIHFPNGTCLDDILSYRTILVPSKKYECSLHLNFSSFSIAHIRDVIRSAVWNTAEHSISVVGGENDATTMVTSTAFDYCNSSVSNVSTSVQREIKSEYVVKGLISPRKKAAEQSAAKLALQLLIAS